jgi:hypothetical protein
VLRRRALASVGGFLAAAVLVVAVSLVLHPGLLGAFLFGFAAGFVCVKFALVFAE